MYKDVLTRKVSAGGSPWTTTKVSASSHSRRRGAKLWSKSGSYLGRKERKEKKERKERKEKKEKKEKKGGC